MSPHLSPIAPVQSLPDVLGPGLIVIFCGINPGVDAATGGHHFIGRGNRFWRVLHLAGFTQQQIAPEDDGVMLEFGYGLTTAVDRPTNRADQLLVDEFTDAAATLLAKVKRYKPLYLAFLGKSAYAAISGGKVIEWGEQQARFGGARVWVLPNPSGRNRSFSLDRLVQAYSELQNSLACRQD
jgi:TDG/mug DNA glycosylase family protein